MQRGPNHSIQRCPRKQPCFHVILSAVTNVPDPEKKTIWKLLVVNPATSAAAAGECSFSSAQPMKTWLKSTMGDKRFSSLAMLNGHEQRTDSVCIADVAQEFVSCNENRKRNFCSYCSSLSFQLFET